MIIYLFFFYVGYLFGSCSADRTAMLWTTNKPNVVKILIGHKKDVQ